MKNGNYSLKGLLAVNIKSVFRQIKRKLKGSLRIAQEEGMRVGKGVTVMGGTDFGSEPYLITLGDNVRISSKVQSVTHDGGTWAFRNLYADMHNVVKFGPITVGEGTFIGAESIIMPGVSIGKHAVIGAGSIVTKDVPDETVWIGVPARQFCTLREYAERCKASMPEDFDLHAYQANKKQYLIEYYMKK